MTSGLQRNTFARQLAGNFASAAAIALLSCAAMTARAQNESKKPVTSTQIVYLHNVTDSRDANDIQTALRNMVPGAALYYAPSAGALTVRGTDAEIQTVERLAAGLDKVKKTWRLTYTVTEIDSSKAAAPQHFTLTIAEGAKTYLKQGTKVPVITGKSGSEHNNPESQVQYLDVGLNLEASLEGVQDGLRLKTRFEQSAIADDSAAHADDPIIQQTTLETTSALAPGKQVSLGSVAEPNSPHHVQVTVMAEEVK